MDLPYKHPGVNYVWIGSCSSMSLAQKVRNTSTCFKQKTGAVITDRLGRPIAVGNNAVRIPQDSCPRADLPTGTAYELCDDKCGGNLHAEVAAVKMLTKDDEPTSIYLYGHWWVCENCAKTIYEAGIRTIYLVQGHGSDTDWSKV